MVFWLCNIIFGEHTFSLCRAEIYLQVHNTVTIHKTNMDIFIVRQISHFGDESTGERIILKCNLNYYNREGNWKPCTMGLLAKLLTLELNDLVVCSQCDAWPAGLGVCCYTWLIEVTETEQQCGLDPCDSGYDSAELLWTWKLTFKFHKWQGIS
jgi:hypothetical protein